MFSTQDDNKLGMLIQVVTDFLQNVVDNETNVAIVEFARDATILRGLEKMSDPGVRSRFVGSLPKYTQPYTSIGRGIRKGIQVSLIN